MLFNSFAFAIFLPIVFILYWLLPHKFRWMLLLAASYYFYMSGSPNYVVLLFITTVASYAAARMMDNNSKTTKRVVLVGITAICLGVLFFFKYFNFTTSSIANFMSLFAIKFNPIMFNLVMPIGISFYTFKTLSYLIDVYNGKIKAENHFGYYATFISFFPDLLAGPIDRTQNLLPQIKEEHKFNYNQATYGLKLMAWGFFEKLVIADTLSKYVNTVYDAPQSFKGFALILATVLFTIQIYCDFSGYSNIAIGSAKLMGIDLMENFKSPYFSQSVREFWSRWHISLSTWFRDYVYIPLGGNRVSKPRHYLNLMITFLASGLWHGANWTFIVWGGVHGLAQIAENAMFGKAKPSKNIFLKWLRIILVFVFASFAWLFFISNSLTDAIYVIGHLFIGIGNPITYLHDGFSNINLHVGNLIWLSASLIILGLYDYVSLTKDVITCISQKKKMVRWIIYVIFILWILFYIPYVNTTEFIYFQF